MSRHIQQPSLRRTAKVAVLLMGGVLAPGLATAAAAAPHTTPLGITLQGIGGTRPQPSYPKASIRGWTYSSETGAPFYTYDKDAPGVSNCVGECATAWPPARPAQGAVGEGAWSIISRKDGGKQWAFHGKPLYTFAKEGGKGEI